MLTSLIITFRESLEIYLFILPLIIYIYKVKKPELSKNIYLGLIAGLLLCIVTGVGLNIYFKSLEGVSIEFAEAILQAFLAGIIIYAIYSLVKMNKEYDFNKISNDVPLRGVSLFMIAFVTVFREGLEVIMYTVPQLIRNPFSTILGMVIGIVLSTLLILALFKTTLKININIIFSLCALFLIYMGSECFANALVHFFPNLGLSVLAAQFIYAIPMLYLFIKYEAKRYIHKKM